MNPPNPHHERRWRILFVLGIAQLMVVLDATIVNVALPSAQHALHFSNADRQWIVTAYALSFGSLLLLGGRISDLFGRKWTFIGGLIGFAAASAAGGAARSFEMFVAARAVQGAFGALLAPAALSLLTTTFTDPAERTKAFGVYGAIAGSGASIGLLLGGILTTTLDWRFTMFVNVGFALLGVVGALALIHNQRPATRPRLDLPGVLTVSAGLFALVFGFNHAETTSWGNPETIGFLAAAVALLGAFGAIESRVAGPLLPPRVITDRHRGASFAAIGIVGATVFGVFLFLTYFLQQDLGYSPLLSGVAFLPMTAMVVLTAAIATIRLQGRFGPRPLVTGGMILSAAGMLLLTRLSMHSSYSATVLPSLVLLGIGLGLIMSTAVNNATRGVDPGDAGVASATVTAAQQVGGSVGTALLSTLAASAATAAVHAGLGVAGPTPALIAAATVHGYTVAFGWAAGILAFGAILAAVLYPSGANASATETVGAEPALAH
ncbi:MAG TPA: MFS transporter [Solirubrobacteraceae bacterium]|jgi:EmrB/QacA subfamily drug resistance transporter|nr:MFS transporter [Solirubrobacteraceae bacterium]